MNPSDKTLNIEKNPASWHGSLDLVFSYNGGNTVLAHDRVKAPLKVQRPFYPEGSEVCHSTILHTAGGIVGGDRLSLNICLEAQAKALITTAAAGRVYRTNGLAARQTIQMQVADGACLEWLPQETIVFDGAIYRQDLRVDLAPKASWLGWEMTRFGRSARGERFLQGDWRSHAEVWQQGRPLWIDRQWLPGREDIFNSPHGLAGQPVVASFAWIGQEVSPELVEKVRSLWDKPSLTLPDPLLSREGQGKTGGDAYLSRGTVGVTRLTVGLLCRYRGSSTVEVRNWFMEVWQLLRLSFLGRTNCTPRVWQI